MNDEQFNTISKKIDKIIALLIIQNFEKINDKIYSLKKLNLTSEEVGELVGVKNPRQMEGWRRK